MLLCPVVVGRNLILEWKVTKIRDDMERLWARWEGKMLYFFVADEAKCADGPKSSEYRKYRS
jgi:hypothetical protein